MTKIIIVAHGHFASGVLSAIELIAGKQPDIQAIDFTAAMSATELKGKLQEVAEQEQDVIILSDLLGGTPFKVSVELSTELSCHIAVVSGLNLAMALEASCLKNICDSQTLAEKLITVAQENIINAANLLKDNVEEVNFEDGI